MGAVMIMTIMIVMVSSGQNLFFVAILKCPMSSFAVKLNEEDEEVEATSWTTKMPKAAQPNLNYIGARTIK